MSRPRFLAARSEYGYTESIVVALRAEPEAISEEDAEMLAERVRDDAMRNERAMLEDRAAQLQRERDYHEAQARHRERQLRRIQAKL